MTGAESFAALLRQHRAAAGLTQEELAERANLAARTISDLERGVKHRPYAYTLQRLVQALRLAEEEASRFQRAVRRPRAAREGRLEPPDRATPTTNFPIQSTPFIGRQREVEELRTLLSREDVRLLTLTGTGGVGKTRLALQVSAGLVHQFPDGVWLVELATLADPTLVPGAVLAAMSVPEQPGRPALDTLLNALRRRQLLVLDNCEHLLEACARLAETVLRACPHVRILATSREQLRLAGEMLWRVPSLSLPATDQPASLELVAQCEAGQLFLDRARAVRPSFALTAANVSVVAEICTRLDGIPLALELAAARLSALGVADLAARLDQRFRLLTGGSRGILPRQQTLRATVEWSYSLLTPQEQTLFNRLSVFVGGWSMEAAEAVGAGKGIAAEEVLDLLVRLVDKSLVIAEEIDEGSTRYRLLETLRQYAWEWLAAAGETPLVQRRHATYYLVLVERAEPELIGPNQLHWLDVLEREHGNLRAALAWRLDGSEQAQREDGMQAVEIGARLAARLHWFWLFRDHSAEGFAWLDQALARGAAAPAAVRAEVAYSAGVHAGRMNDIARAQALLTQAVTLSREVGNRRQLSVALSVLGWSTWLAGQEEQAAAILEESLTLARAVGEPWLIGHALLHSVFRVANSVAIERAEERARAGAAGEDGLHFLRVAGDQMSAAMMELHLGRIALYEGNYERARAGFVACLPMLRSLGWQSNAAEGLVRLADVARAQDDDAEASALYTEALTLYYQLGDQWLPAVAWVRSRLAAIALEQRKWTVAQIHVAESLTIARDTGWVGVPERATELAGVLEVRAALAADQGAPLRAARLAGAAAALRMQFNRPLATSESVTLERRLATVRQVLSAEKQAQAWAEGQAMTPRQAITYALDGLPSHRGAPLRLKSACADKARGERPLQTSRSTLTGTNNVLPLPMERQRTVDAAPASPRLSRTERQAWTLEHLSRVSSLSPRTYAAMLAVSVDTALRDLRELVDRGAVHATGTTRNRRYILAGSTVESTIHRTAR